MRQVLPLDFLQNRFNDGGGDRKLVHVQMNKVKFHGAEFVFESEPGLLTKYSFVKLTFLKHKSYANP